MLSTFKTLVFGPGATAEPQRTSLKIWWDEETIRKVVTRDFVRLNLRADQHSLLEATVASWDGRTDGTYLEWILERSRRVFLILVDIGVPDEIFALIDSSWGDDDLPISLEEVDRLKLPVDGDHSLGKKFCHRQHDYLLRPIHPGDHLDYTQDEIVPVEPVNKLPGIHLSHTAEKVHIAGKSGLLCTRRRIVFNDSAAREQAFYCEIDTIKSLPHPHLVSVWASYTYKDCGYALLSPACDINLKDFLQVSSRSYRILPKPQRRRLILNWLHCLSSGLAFIHRQGYSYGEIKPTNIWIDGSNTIFFADIGGLRRLEAEHKVSLSPDLEEYGYDAPENFQRQPYVPAPSPPPSSPTRVVHVGGSRTSRRISAIPIGATGDAESGRLPLSGSYESNYSRPFSPSTNRPFSSSTDRRFSSGVNRSKGVGGSVLTFQSWTSEEDEQHTPAQRADIFSLGCIYLDLTSFLLKMPKFSSYLAGKNRRAGRGIALPDSSFHQNLVQVGPWANLLEKAASKKDDKLFRSIPTILDLCKQMIVREPTCRPRAQSVEQALYEILVPVVTPETPHCGPQVIEGRR